MDDAGVCLCPIAVEVVHAVQMVDDGACGHQLRAVGHARVKRRTEVGRRNVFFEKDPTLKGSLAKEAVRIELIVVVVVIFVRRWVVDGRGSSGGVGGGRGTSGGRR